MWFSFLWEFICVCRVLWPICSSSWTRIYLQFYVHRIENKKWFRFKVEENKKNGRQQTTVAFGLWWCKIPDGETKQKIEKNRKRNFSCICAFVLDQSRCNFFNQASSLCWMPGCPVWHTCETNSHSRKKQNKREIFMLIYVSHWMRLYSINFLVFSVFILFLLVGNNKFIRKCENLRLKNVHSENMLH